VSPYVEVDHVLAGHLHQHQASSKADARRMTKVEDDDATEATSTAPVPYDAHAGI
jgi:hypothetical protein